MRNSHKGIKFVETGFSLLPQGDVNHVYHVYNYLQFTIGFLMYILHTVYAGCDCKKNRGGGMF